MIEQISKVTLSYDIKDENEWVNSHHDELITAVDDILKEYAVMDIDYFGGCGAAEPSIVIELMYDPCQADEINQRLITTIETFGYEVYGE